MKRKNESNSPNEVGDYQAKVRCLEQFLSVEQQKLIVAVKELKSTHTNNMLEDQYHSLLIQALSLLPTPAHEDADYQQGILYLAALMDTSWFRDLAVKYSKSNQNFNNLLIAYQKIQPIIDPNEMIREGEPFSVVMIKALAAFDKLNSDWLMNNVRAIEWNKQVEKGDYRGATALWWLSFLNPKLIIKYLVNNNLSADVPFQNFNWNATIS